jgi:nucleoside-diphosphate-sugar epimerase
LRALVTGAGGFIGAPFIKKLQANDDVEYIVAVDRKDVTPTQGIVDDPDALWISENLDEVTSAWWEFTIATYKIDTIFYLESLENDNSYVCTHEMNCKYQISDFNFVKYLETRPLVESADDLKLAYISTDKIYYEDDFPNEVHSITLNSEENPTATDKRKYFYRYVAAKALTEICLQHAAKIDLRIIRPFSITGPGRDPRDPLAQYVDLALKDQDIQLYNQGRQGVAFTHVNDLATFLDHKNLFDADIKQSLTSNVINFCRVQNYLTVQQVAAKIINKVDSKSKITQDNTENIFEEVIDTPQIRNMFRIYAPTTTIEIIMDEMIYDQNPVNFYAPLKVTSVTFNSSNGTIIVTGTVEPESAVVLFFGNGESTSIEADTSGNFVSNYTFQFAHDVYPLEIKATTKDNIQYASVVLTSTP